MEHTITQLKHLGINLIYEKKKHFNAADRKRKLHTANYISNIALSLFPGSVLLYYLCDSGNKVFIIASFVISLIVAILTAIQKFLNLDLQADGHVKIGVDCLNTYRQICVTLALSADGKLTGQELIQRTEQVLNSINDIHSVAKQFSTSSKDYKKAHDGIVSGEENYTDDEMDILN